MLNYETVRQGIVAAAEAADLQLQNIRETMEIRTCDRECEIHLHLPGEEESSAAAIVGFLWDATLTAESVYGDSPPLGSDPDTIFELEIRYTFDPPPPEEVPQVVTALQEIFRQEIPHENRPTVQIQLGYLADGRLVVQEAGAGYWWELDAGAASLDIREILLEVKQVLGALRGSGFFPRRPPWIWGES